ncbi:MAG: hypothetical protein KAU03_06450 [Candidatus Altiarchaeales archaeon]|nr:hypothetical protein [Candidatus Altiarchaeales archaeon]
MEVINEKVASLAEVRKILENKEKVYQEEEYEMFYEQKRALEHAQKCTKLNLRDTKKLIKELSEMKLKLNKEWIIKMVDLLPEDVDDVRAIFAKERFKYDEGDIRKILDVIAKYR